MKALFLTFFATLFSLFTVVNAAGLSTSDQDKRISVDNRILAKVNGKAISVIDVMKKMDMLFYKAYPEYTSVLEARYQFYQMNWKRVLEDLVDKELIIADAEEIKFPISNGDVRQEMETLFGPNIISNLDKIGLSYEEAWKIVSSDILLKQMLFVRGQAKAIKQVTPQVVHDAYEEFAKNNIRPATWDYVVISIRDQDKDLAAEASFHVHKMLTEEKIPLQDLPAKIKELYPQNTGLKVTLSDVMHHQEKELSESYKNKLLTLRSGSFSEPIAQKSRSDATPLFRIFYLKEQTTEGPIPFSEIAKTLKDKLIDDGASKESDLYIKKLRKHFDVQESRFEADFQPFRLI